MMWVPCIMLCHPIQRYKFESNSQRYLVIYLYHKSCVIRYKDTNLKAIHNYLNKDFVRVNAVSSDTKIQIWKQFTTAGAGSAGKYRLCHPIQRYKFESNSQPFRCVSSGKVCCVIRYKDTNLKAIHNEISTTMNSLFAVSSDTKIQIWKQFTTERNSPLYAHMLCHPIQRYKFESNSQQKWHLPLICTCCVIRYKDTNLKAIHNKGCKHVFVGDAVSSDTKIQIWKQFTTCQSQLHARAVLCHPIQRYKFESNSQQENIQTKRQRGCVIRYKDTNLKAIHNRIQQAAHSAIAVSSDTKIQIWKQFTTSDKTAPGSEELCHPIQRYKFESNSQLWTIVWRVRSCCVIRYKDTNLKAIHNWCRGLNIFN